MYLRGAKPLPRYDIPSGVYDNIPTTPNVAQVIATPVVSEELNSTVASLVEFMSVLASASDNIPQQYRASARIVFHGEADYEGIVTSVTYAIEYLRPEKAGEHANRQAALADWRQRCAEAEQERVARQEAIDHAVYERLRARYEGRAT